MTKRRLLLLSAGLLALACAGPASEQPPEPAVAAPRAPAAPEVPTLDDPRKTPHDPPEPLLKPEPLRREQHAALCAEHNACALLVHYTLEQLEGGDVCTLCGDQDAAFCELDWPFSDVPPCSEWHELERCVWLTTGARRLPDLDIPARQNVIELQRRLDDQIACVPD